MQNIQCIYIEYMHYFVKMGKASCDIRYAKPELKS